MHEIILVLKFHQKKVAASCTSDLLKNFKKLQKKIWSKLTKMSPQKCISTKCSSSPLSPHLLFFVCLLSAPEAGKNSFTFATCELKNSAHKKETKKKLIRSEKISIYAKWCVWMCRPTEIFLRKILGNMWNLCATHLLMRAIHHISWRWNKRWR